MARKRYTAEQIINHLREVEILVSQGGTVRDAIRPFQDTVGPAYATLWSDYYRDPSITRETPEERCRLAAL